MVGTQIGQYRIVQRIGVGGMGSVYRGEHVQIGRLAAVKVLHSEFTTRPDIVTRFFNEARAATQVSDPGIVQIFDFGTHTDGSAYIVMELLEGEPLDERVRRLGALPIADALKIMRQVASSLGAAHARGIVHRDLKPENVYLCRDPEVVGGERAKLLDFGIAKLLFDTQGPKTNTSTVIGTPLYMSPEQCRGSGQIDQRSDIYSLGCLLMKLLTGETPFVAEGHGELIIMHVQEPAPRPSSRVRGIPEELDALVLRCLEKNPAHRFTSGTDLAFAIEQLVTGVSYPTGAPQFLTPTPVIAMHSAPTTLSAATGQTALPASGKRRGFVIGGVAVAALAIGGGVFVATRGDGVTPQNVAPQEPTPVAKAAAALVAAPAVVDAKPDSRNADALAQLGAAVTSFKAWARAHPHDACPTGDTLGAHADPWGTALSVTCTDQPGDQIVGVISAGPDKKLGTADDLQSWDTGDARTLAHGPRWKSTPVVGKQKGVATKPPTSGFVDLDGDGIPDKR